MGGRIWVESEVGRGSRFSFVAHFGVAARGRRHKRRLRSPRTSADLRVLVVDDNATNRRIVEEMLTAWRMRPTSVDGARAALDALAKAVDAGEPFRLVLSDALMPDVDGFALARAIRANARFAGTKLIMLSSMGLPPGHSRVHEAGFSAYLSKPVKQSDLLDAIVAVFAPRTSQRSTGGAGASGAASARANASASPAGGRRQRDQSEGGRHALREPRGHGRRRVERSRGRSAICGDSRST